MALVGKAFKQKVEACVLDDAAQGFVGRGQATETRQSISQLFNLGLFRVVLDAVQQRSAIATMQPGVGEERDVLW